MSTSERQSDKSSVTTNEKEQLLTVSVVVTPVSIDADFAVPSIMFDEQTGEDAFRLSTFTLSANEVRLTYGFDIIDPEGTGTLPTDVLTDGTNQTQGAKVLIRVERFDPVQQRFRDIDPIHFNRSGLDGLENGTEETVNIFTFLPTFQQMHGNRVRVRISIIRTETCRFIARILFRVLHGKPVRGK